MLKISKISHKKAVSSALNRNGVMNSLLLIERLSFFFVVVVFFKVELHNKTTE